ncbi:hypothetical protein ACFL6D_00040 [Spirochaetota bacterium]
MKRSLAIIFTVCISSFLLSAERLVTKYYENADLHQYTREFVFFNRISKKNTFGLWKNSVITGKKNIRFRKEYFDSKKRSSYVEVHFNREMKPVRVLKKRHGSTKNNISISYLNGRTSMIRHVSGEVVRIHTYRYNEAGRLSKIDVAGLGAYLYYFDTFTYKGNEIKMISYFPDGSVRHVDIFRIISPDAFSWKRKTYVPHRHAVAFEAGTAGEESGSREALYKEMAAAWYESLSDPDVKEEYWKYPSQDYIIHQKERGMPMKIIYKTNNFTVKEKIIYNDTYDYTVVSYDKEIPGYYKEIIYTAGLLRERNIYYREEKMQKEIFKYFPSDKPMSYSMYINDRLVSVESFSE